MKEHPSSAIPSALEGNFFVLPANAHADALHTYAHSRYGMFASWIPLRYAALVCKESCIEVFFPLSRYLSHEPRLHAVPT
jgi:hypothetical protein